MALKVLHLVESLTPDAGNVAASFPGLFGALDASDISSEVIALDSANDDRDHPKGASSNPFPRKPGEVKRLMEKVDVVHLHLWNDPRARRIAQAARRMSKPYVVSGQGALFNGAHNKRTWRRKLGSLLSERRLLRKAAAITALNECEGQDLRSQCLNARIIQLPYGINIDDYQDIWESRAQRPTGEMSAAERAPTTAGESGGPGASRLLLMLGPIHPVEGLVPLLKAFAELGRDADGWGVVLAGPETGDWRKILEAAIRRKGEEERIVIAPITTASAQRDWLERASILVAPSLKVRSPVSIIQAIAVGVPVLASTFAAPGGLDDVIRICPATQGDIRNSLRSLLGMSDQERSELARRAREVARKIFDWPILVEQYVQLYRSIA